jgi:hypothetical protein
MQCCTGNATSGIYYAWEAITRCERDHAQVNLFLNRAAPWLDIDSHLPYEGRVVIRNKTARRASVRIPPWVSRSRLECLLNGAAIRPGWVARYAVFDDLKPGDVMELKFPVTEKTVIRTAHSGKPGKTVYTIRTRANTVLDISPRDESPLSYPFYLRDHVKGDKAPMKTVKRFVGSIIPRW